MPPAQQSTIEPGRPSSGEDARGEALRAGLVFFALYHLALAVFMAVAPHAFFTAIGPFGALNRHYIRDTATFEAALGVGFLLALRRPSWRLPVVAVTAVQFALHTVNHLLDASSAHPEWTGWFDFASLLASTLVLIWMARTAARLQAPIAHAPVSAPVSDPHTGPDLAPSPLPGRSPS